MGNSGTAMTRMEADFQAMNPGMSIEVGKKYLFRDYPNLELPDLTRIKVKDISKLGDGTVVVTYKKHLMTEHMELKDFEKHIVKWKVQSLNYVEE